MVRLQKYKEHYKNKIERLGQETVQRSNLWHKLPSFLLMNTALLSLSISSGISVSDDLRYVDLYKSVWTPHMDLPQTVATDLEPNKRTQLSLHAVALKCPSEGTESLEPVRYLCEYMVMPTSG